MTSWSRSSPREKPWPEANAQLEAANTKLAEVNALVKDLTEKLAVLTKELNEAMAEKASAGGRRGQGHAEARPGAAT